MYEVCREYVSTAYFLLSNFFIARVILWSNNGIFIFFKGGKGSTKTKDIPRTYDNMSRAN